LLLKNVELWGEAYIYNYIYIYICLYAANDKLCLNVTSSLIQILKTTQASWRQDLERNAEQSPRTRQGTITSIFFSNTYM